MLKSSGGGAPAFPGSVAATNRMLAKAGSAITSAYEPAPHIPPGSSNTVRWASTGPASRSSHSTATRLVSEVGPAPATCGRRRRLVAVQLPLLGRELAAEPERVRHETHRHVGAHLRLDGLGALGLVALDQHATVAMFGDEAATLAVDRHDEVAVRVLAQGEL